MNDEQLKHLLKTSDQLPKPVYISEDKIRERLYGRKSLYRKTCAIAAVFFLILLLGAMLFINRNLYYPRTKPIRVENDIEIQLRQLSTHVEQLTTLVDRVIVQHKYQQKIITLKAQMAALEDPLDTIKAQVDKVAAFLVEQAGASLIKIKHWLPGEAMSVLLNYIQTVCGPKWPVNV